MSFVEIGRGYLGFDAARPSVNLFPSPVKSSRNVDFRPEKGFKLIGMAPREALPRVFCLVGPDPTRRVAANVRVNLIGVEAPSLLPRMGLNLRGADS